MNLDSWLAYIESQTAGLQNNFELVQSIAVKFKLIAFPSKVITIAGTNGKGSCAAILEAVLRADHQRVAVFTSPHLHQFNERLRINGESCSSDLFCAAFTQLKYYIKHITYYEFITLAALLILQSMSNELDVIVLEVGLGGRLDAVNVVEPDVAVITSIGLDHQDLLGSTREQIAEEKAGIMRCNKPVVCGDKRPPKNLIQLAKQIGASWYCCGQEFSYQADQTTWQWHCADKNYSGLVLPRLPIENAATTLMILRLLGVENVAAINQGLAQAKLEGRFETQGQTIFDVAHNGSAAELLAQNLLAQTAAGQIAVIAVAEDKDLTAILLPLIPIIDTWYVGEFASKRSMSADKIIEKLQDLGVNRCYNFGRIEQAYLAAKQVVKSDEQIIVFGSFYTVAAVKTLLLKGDC